MNHPFSKLKGLRLKLFLSAILLFFALALFAQKVRIKGSDGNYQLLVDEKPFFIKGAVANEYFERISMHGGNSIRSDSRNLDKMKALGLKVLVNLPASAERNKFDYNDTTAVRIQKDRILSIVRNVKDHPSVLMWAIGNELDFIPGNLQCNLKLWDAINDVAKAIKIIDPDHPVMTVVGTDNMGKKMKEIISRCPDLDLIGLNTYGDMIRLPRTLKQQGWNKPYIITEWGPDGYWERPRTKWNAPYEQTGLQKASSYEKKYSAVILEDKGRCLGEFVFYWSGFKQETTHTWFCMFDKNGNESASVDIMHRFWLGKEPENHAPSLDSMWIDGFQNVRSIYLNPETEYKAKAFASDTDLNLLNFAWEIRPEASYASYAGQGEKEPQPLPGLIKNNGTGILFSTPLAEGAYRLFVYVYDGNGKFSTANLPLYVKKQDVNQ